MGLKVAWFVIAVVLLLGHTSALAKQYLRVCKNGVVSYITNPEPTHHWQGGKNTSKLRRAVCIELPPPHPGPSPSSVMAPVRAPAEVDLAASSLQGALYLAPLPLGTSDAVPVVRPPDVPENIGASTRYLVRLLTKLGYYYHPALPGYDTGTHWMHRQKDAPSIYYSQIAVPDAWVNLLKSAQEQRPELVQVQPDPRYLKDARPQLYSFPVASPFSFRDSWDDPRSGGRRHRAVDIVANEGTEVYAITSGVIQTLATSPGAGIMLLMRGQDGMGYGYMHLQGYAAGIVEGKAVRPGELIGYVGRTGVQESAAHLHFQVYADNRLCKDDLLNPYDFLVQLCHGVGVTNLSQHQMARLQTPESKGNQLQVSRLPARAASKRKEYFTEIMRQSEPPQFEQRHEDLLAQTPKVFVIDGTNLAKKAFFH